ncbi:DUF4262 domain-containing protein [Williamsia phyllosphaerae]|uniref:DUF4262 domain-containing protein n=1 Tax=Williamsia phyllosphaerae TaxID=885042 RepID=A0ABQ1UTC4_9NOCA|nr:DUF4262 domain-containing protein [Williamsia phyllosphaerae]GGF25009.1 hypothetical protein GCM10007298_21130 [Williamsia phyllosphaerae]
MTDRHADRRGLPRWHPSPLVQSAITTIRALGWSVMAVSDECSCASLECEPPDCSFAYTSGLHLGPIPELAVYGLDARTAQAVLNEMVDVLRWRNWRTLVEHEIEFTIDSIDSTLRLIELVDKSDLLITNELFPDAAVLQVVWADDHGAYPWEEGYSLEVRDQFIKGVEGVGRDVGPRVISRSTGPNRAQRRKRKR